MHFTHIESPLINAQNVREIEEYPLPDLDAPYRWQGKKNEVLALQNQGFAVGIGVNHIFETSWQIRGIEQFLSDLYLEYEMCEVLTERIFQIRLGMMKQAAMTGADVIHVGDDVGTQNGMMFSPEIWRKLFKPRLKKLAGAAKNLNPEVLIWYHSDGNIYDIIPDLIEIGIDILNPVQPECMDPYLLKSKYGQDLSFWGILGTQQLLPFGTPQQIRDEIRRLIDIAGKNGGLLLAPTHVLEPEVPLENIAAVIKTIEEYGVYKK
ncbi:MAG: hypothetical protein A2096_17520 [Spirochaetes bacterium GWF1_41_5]|nr:MAG: hypothetical protein A2096_17520 [Spirochaetes bacterium GWF1_41_5]